ncbi:MAG: glutathione S-transferase family protein [Actinomycetota bacterium]|nr:glutathione S-transferase family protein [Actinomycetota bacterium]
MLGLYSMNTCPYAQRTRMVLAHKVPALKVGDATLYESAIINEYLDEAYPEKRLLNEDPLERASQRILIDCISNRFVPLLYQLLVGQEEAWEGYKEEMLADFDYFESLLRDRTWLSGDEFSLTDVSLLPWFERLVVLEHYRDFGLPASLKELNRWWRACQKRPEFEATKSEPDLLIENYAKYASPARETGT